MKKLLRASGRGIAVVCDRIKFSQPSTEATSFAESSNERAACALARKISIVSTDNGRTERKKKRKKGREHEIRIERESDKEESVSCLAVTMM